MAEIKSASAIAAKWARVTPGRAEDYKTGVQNPKRDWAEETTAAKANWKAGVERGGKQGPLRKGRAGRRLEEVAGKDPVKVRAVL